MKQSPTLWLLLLVFFVVATRLIAIYQTDTTSVYTTPLVDDSYYYFALGHHLADGDGIKVDGVHDTTGFQPLWGFLIAIPYALFPNNLVLPITGIQLMGMIVSVGTTCLMFLLGSRIASTFAATVVTALIMLSPYSIATSVNGMETALAILMTVALFVCLHELYRAPSPKSYVLTGLICGAAFLARVDTLFLTGTFLLMILIRPVQVRQRWLPPVIVGFWALIGILPWSIITLGMGKSPLPESGEAVRIISHLLRGTQAEPISTSMTSLLSADFISVFAQKFIQFLAEFALRIDFSALRVLSPIPINSDLSMFAFVFVVMLITALPLMFASRLPQFRMLVITLGIYVAILFVLYPAVVQSDWFFNRYVAPISAMFTFFSALYLFREYVQGWKARIRLGLIMLMVAAYAVIVLKDGAYKWMLYGSAARSSESHYDAVLWINANIPAQSLIGGFQTGLIGYYSSPTVINLDGKVNADARHALVKAQMGDYLCDVGVEYVVDQPMIIQHLLVERTAKWNDAALTLLYTAVGEPDNPMQIYRLNCDALKSVSP